MGKKQKENIIRKKDSKSITFDFELRVPKKEFDELLRRMANIKKEDESPNEETDKKRRKRRIEIMKLFLYLQRIIE